MGRVTDDGAEAEMRERTLNDGASTALSVGRRGTRRPDIRSLVVAPASAAGFLALGLACLSLSRFDLTLASVWLPNAAAVALLLCARLRNELPTYIGIAIAGLAANLLGGNPALTSAVYAVANVADIALVTWLTRRYCGPQPDMTDPGDVGRFVAIGGFVGPVVSAMIAAPAMGADPRAIWIAASSWFLADSMGMILTVPSILLAVRAWPSRRTLAANELRRRGLLVLIGLGAVALVFAQHRYPLLFLVPPITMFVAFRLGPVGTALYVPGIAVVTTWMTFTGTGPIVAATTSDIGKMYLIQLFVAANFLTGLPIAAVLLGRARIAEELAHGRRELSLLADGITDAVLKIGGDGICTYASPSVRDVLGRDPEDFVGKHAAARTHPQDTNRIVEALDRLLSGEKDKERLTYRRLLDDAHGNPVFIEADAAAAFDHTTGERDGVIVSARDVTERVELELLLTRARRKAEHAASAKSEFLANMSHEIRTPMNGVLGFADLMLQDDLDPAHRRHTEMIVQSGRSMMLLLNDILDLSKIEAGHIAVQTAPVDLAMTVAECAALQRPNAESKGLELTVTGEGDAARSRKMVLSDALRLRQIVLNLLGNAVKFTERGSINVRYWAGEKEFGIEVRDTGIGIGTSRLETIFNPFTQAESDIARRFGGTGLGLTISRQLAMLLGGSIEVESKPGKGSCFRLVLPASYVSAPVPHEDARPPVEATELPRSARILLVEDHDVNRVLATEMLERCGQSVASAHDGNEAIAMVMDSLMRGDSYDLVLMDIQMPGCDGYAATRAIRAEGITAETLPIVALTANAFPEDVAAAREAGMQAHLAKPLVFAELARALQRWLPTKIVESEPSPADIASGERRTAGTGMPHGSDPRREEAIHPSRRYTDESADRCAARREVSLVTTIDARAPQRLEDTPGPAKSEHKGSPREPDARGGVRPSASLAKRWTERRGFTIGKVRESLERGVFGSSEPAMADAREELKRLLHKVAGTAAVFGEAELGTQAAALERALRTDADARECEALAFDLLTIADNPVDRRCARRD